MLLLYKKSDRFYTGWWRTITKMYLYIDTFYVFITAAVADDSPEHYCNIFLKRIKANDTQG